jgi:hypothetical protein
VTAERRAAVERTLPQRQAHSRGSSGDGPLDGAPVQEQRVQLLALGLVPLDWRNPTHQSIMQGLFQSWTGRAPPVPGPGAHWLELGFQGEDPATDLRGCGMLGALQLLHLPQSSPAGAAALLRLARRCADGAAGSARSLWRAAVGPERAQHACGHARGHHGAGRPHTSHALGGQHVRLPPRFQSLKVVVPHSKCRPFPIQSPAALIRSSHWQWLAST